MRSRKNVLLALNWYHPEIHRGVAEFASKHNWNLCSEPALYSGFLPTNWHGDGVITHMCNQMHFDYVTGLGLNAVSIERPLDPDYCSSISIDPHSITKMAVEYLLGKGYKRFGWFVNKKVIEPVRLKLFKHYLPDEYECSHLDYPTIDDWKRQRLQLTRALKKFRFPMAVFTPDDNAAAELITACLDHGIRVPEDVAVLGVHNDPLVCESLSVPLSSIAINFHRLGYLLAYMLDRRMRGKENKARHFQLRAEGVVTRLSTDAIAVDHPQVAKALRYIHQNFPKGITVADVVRRSKFTEAGLSKAFQQHVGRTVGQELRRVKLERAEKLLIETELPVSEVAFEAGFAEYHALYDTFKRDKGITPKQYRKENKQ